MFQLPDQHHEAGGSFIDRANVYAAWMPGFHGGESETTIGRWLKERPNRASVFIAKRLGSPNQDTEGGPRAHHIDRECKRSLKRLGTDTIDLYYAHIDPRETPLKERLKASGRSHIPPAAAGPLSTAHRAGPNPLGTSALSSFLPRITVTGDHPARALLIGATWSAHQSAKGGKAVPATGSEAAGLWVADTVMRSRASTGPSTAISFSSPGNTSK